VTEIALRPVTEADGQLLRAVYRSTREDELDHTPWTEEQKAAFVEMQFVAQDTHYRTHLPDASYDVVVVDGEDAGRLYVDRRESEVRIVDIAILPAFRGRGIGTKLLDGILAEAAATGRKVSIHVEHENRARSLYDRLGFVQVEDQGVYLLLEWTPPS
jgi:ribosomal protein S18 acetylase RimI-like enzyme